MTTGNRINPILTIDAQPLYVWSYQCIECQTRHHERAPLYHRHILYQSKHGMEMVAVPGAWVARRPLTTPSQKV